MFTLHLLVFLINTVWSKNFLVELAEDKNTTSPELEAESESLNDVLEKIIQEVQEEIEEEIGGGNIVWKINLYLGAGNDYTTTAKRCRGKLNIRQCLNAKDGTHCKAGGKDKWSDSECCNGCCKRTRHVYKKVPGATNSCGFYEGFKRSISKGCGGATNIAQCLNKPDGSKCKRNDKWGDSECCNGCCRHTQDVYKNIPGATNSCGIIDRIKALKRSSPNRCKGITNIGQCMDKADGTECKRNNKNGKSECCSGCCTHTFHMHKSVRDAKNSCGLMKSVRKAIADGCKGTPNIAQCLDKPDNTKCTRFGPSSCCKGCCQQEKGKKNTCGIGPAFFEVQQQGHCKGRENIEQCLGKPDGTGCKRSGWKENSSCCKQCCMANGSPEYICSK